MVFVFIPENKRLSPRAMLARTCSPCNRTISQSASCRCAKVWSCALLSVLLICLFVLRCTMGSRTPSPTAISFLRGWPTRSFFRPRSATTWSAGVAAWRICSIQDGRAISGRAGGVSSMGYGTSWDAETGRVNSRPYRVRMGIDGGRSRATGQIEGAQEE